MLVLYNIVCSVSNIMMMLPLVGLILESYCPEHNSLFMQSLVIFLTQLPLSMLPSFEKFMVCSKFGLFADWFLFFVVLIDSIITVRERGVQPVNEANPDKFFYFFGLIFFAYDISSIMVAVRSEMKEPKKFTQCIVTETFFNFVLQALIGIMGSFAYGAGLKEFIFLNIAHKLKE